MDKIRLAFNSYHIIEEMDLNWIDLLAKNLREETINHINNSNLDLHVIALLIKQTLFEAENKDEIDRILWTKLNDWNLIVSLTDHVKESSN